MDKNSQEYGCVASHLLCLDAVRCTTVASHQCHSTGVFASTRNIGGAVSVCNYVIGHGVRRRAMEFARVIMCGPTGGCLGATNGELVGAGAPNMLNKIELFVVARYGALEAGGWRVSNWSRTVAGETNPRHCSAMKASSTESRKRCLRVGGSTNRQHQCKHSARKGATTG